jgi:MOSC domain-containing protein
MATVSWLSIAPVKGLALVHPNEIELERTGVADNRRFHLIDETGRQFGLLRHGRLVQVRPEYDSASDRLALRFPDGSSVAAEVALGEAVTTRLGERDVPGRLVEGPWSEAISAHAGRPLRLVKADRPGGAVDRGRGQVSLVSDASVEEIGRQGGREDVDARRFRMLLGVADCDPHEEDEWVQRHVQVGEAVVRLRGHVARCAITTQNPDTGVLDFDTLRTIKAYRGLRNGGLDFGVFGEVVEPGRVRVGDPVEPLEQGLF